jgi:hypothetical protein
MSHAVEDILNWGTCHRHYYTFATGESNNGGYFVPYLCSRPKLSKSMCNIVIFYFRPTKNMPYYNAKRRRVWSFSNTQKLSSKIILLWFCVMLNFKIRGSSSCLEICYF